MCQSYGSWLVAELSSSSGMPDVNLLFFIICHTSYLVCIFRKILLLMHGYLHFLYVSVFSVYLRTLNSEILIQ